MRSPGFFWFVAIILFVTVSAFGQTTPNLENGFKPYGSYDGGNLDTVNVMNGNLMLHVPMPWNYPQRGGIDPVNLSTVSAKTWHEQCDVVNGIGVCHWSNNPSGLDELITLAGTGVGFDFNMDVALHRTWQSDASGGVTSYSDFGYYLTTADGTTHQLWGNPSGPIDPTGQALSLDAIDTTGYHVDLTNVDSTTGIPAGAAVRDRHGNVYQMGQYGSACTHSTSNGSNGSETIVTCNQAARIAGITDVSGNVYTVAGSNGAEDTMGRTFLSFASSAPASASAESQCVGGSLTVTSATTYSYPGPNGTTNQITACYATLNEATNFGVSGVYEIQNAPDIGQPVQALVLVTLIMPDGAKWTFSYDSYVELTEVGLPLGGSISYTWNTTFTSATCGQQPSRSVASRTLTDNNGHSYTWNYSWGAPGNTSMTNTITDALGNDTVHVFSALDVNKQGYGCAFYETSTQSYQGTGSRRQLLKQVDTTYSSAILADQSGGGADLGNVVPTSIKTTVYPSGEVSQVTKSYDTGLGNSAPIFGNVVTEKDYDSGQGAPGGLLREIDTTYQWQVNNAYLTAHLLDLPSSVIVKDGSGNKLAETDYTYDESSYLTPSGITTQHGAPPNSVRGNLTTVRKWLNTSSNPVVSHSNWYDTGELHQAIDPLGNTTTHFYDPYYVGAYSTETTNALGQTVSGTHDFNTGLLTSFTDANASSQASGNTPGDPAHTSNYTYDFMSRMTLAQLPPDPSGNRPQTEFQYPVPVSLPFTVTKTTWVTPSLTDPLISTYDGLGRAYKTQHELPNGTAEVDTSYDALDHVLSLSNPYFSTSDPTYGVIHTQYDALGRVTQTTKQDGSITTAQFDQTSSTSTNGDCTTTTDEAGKSRKSCVDGLGRLIEVDEPQASSGSMTNPYVTLYSYDALGKLLSVNQKGDGSQAARVRTFTYDSLSRLLTANNPESGQISYLYDADGNVLQKTSPAPNQTGTATQTISYCYDQLNRVSGKTYSVQSCPLSSPVVAYAYDQGTNGIGHLTSLTDQPGSGSYSYDALGRISTEQRSIAGIQKSLGYTYNLDNSVATLTYPSGATVAYTPWNNGSVATGAPAAAADSVNDINYITGGNYGPDGSMTAFISGNSSSFAGITSSFTFNNRLQPVNMSATSPACTGSGCSASVTISGKLSIADSLSGTPAPNAAVGSAIASFADANGVQHWAYFGSNQHLYHIFWSAAGGFAYMDLTVESGAPAAAVGSALTSVVDGGGTQHFIYLGANQHVYQIAVWPSGFLSYEDRTAMTGAPAAAAGSALTSLLDPSGGQHFVYVGSNQHLYDAYWTGKYGYTDLTATAEAPTAATGSALSSFLDSYPTQHFIYLGTNQHAEQIAVWPGGSFSYEDRTAATGAPAAAAGSALTSLLDSSGGQHFVYLGTNQHLYDAYWIGNYGYTDLTAAAGAPAAAAGSALSSLLDSSGTQHFIYLGTNQHVEQIAESKGGSFTDEDRTATTGAPVAAAGSALSSFQDSGGGQHFVYEAGNQHLYQANWIPGPGYGYTDLNSATPGEVLDSGTVSLNVDGFTATACFGSSTNPACTGQPVNTTASQVAAALATVLNTSNSPVAATASGATMNLTWKSSGSAGAVDPLSSTHDNPSLFSHPSFTSVTTGFSGGSSVNQPVFNISYNFNLGNGDNGNVIAITNNRDTTRSQSFTYDALNRLTSAQNAGTNCSATTVNGGTEYWGNSYAYDPWGNLLQKNVTKCSAEHLNVTALANNQLTGYGYDAAGNMTYDATTTNTYTFDQENRITGAGGYTYTYDADGNRVEKSNGSTGTIYWYMSPGIVAESDLSGNLKSEYVLFDGERIARKDYPSSAVSYYFSDHLKTASVITDSAGNIKEDEDYYPWGGELQMVNNDSNHYKFGSHERDSETGLDYFGARHYSNWLGRFVTPDWSEDPGAAPYANLHDPQSLNLYGYVRNIPTTRVDPDGHADCTTDQKTGTSHCVVNAKIAPETDGSPGAAHKTENKAQFTYAINRWLYRSDQKIDNFLAPAYKHFGNALEVLNPCSVPGLSCGIAFPTGGLGPVLKGAAGVEKAIAEIQAEGGQVVGREVTMTNSAGTARVDLVYRDASGTLKLAEVKNGPTARLNANQRAVYDAATREGAKFAGGNASGLPANIGPTQVRVFKY